MNIRIFFDQVNEDLILEDKDGSWLGNNLSMYRENFPEIQNSEICIIGITESRGSESQKGLEGAADAIRKKLYKLKKGNFVYRICDLGNLRCGISVEDSYLRVKEVCEYLLSIGTFPLLIGGSHDMDYGQFLSYEASEKLINVLGVDAYTDLSADKNRMNTHHLHKILVHEPNYLFHYTHLGYQAFLTDPDSLNVLEKLSFETIRLGQLRENISEAEPLIRYADMITFDISAIRMQDAPGKNNPLPFGISGEEACQIAWYAGLSDRLSSFGIYEYNPEEDHKEMTAMVIATMIWYFIEGFAHRVKSEGFPESEYMKYIVDLSAEPHKLVFYKSRRSEKWWMEVPYPSGVNYSDKTTVVPCSYSDYQTANTGEVPDRWILFHSKLI